MSKVVARFKFFNVVEVESLGSTRKFELVSGRSGKALAEVSWYGPWRQYCFFPAPNTVWSDSCLESAKSFLKRIKAEYWAAREEAKAATGEVSQ